ncbi:MAG: oxidoreductase [Candidatus Hydrogenedentota bacterium]
MTPHSLQCISGWGNAPREQCQIYRPNTPDSIRETLDNGIASTWIPRGLGRSYGDPAINGNAGVIALDRTNCMISFDSRSGILEAEAGVSLAEIIDAFLPRGWFLPVTPGTKFVTLGGAIANDIHGKNHHVDGSFSRYVMDFTLLTPNGSVLNCSRDLNADVFWATVGGIGLTGIILTVRMQLLKVESAYIRTDYRRCPNVEVLLQAIAETDQAYRYSVAWVDCLATGAYLGRSVLMSGDHVRAADMPHDADPFYVKPKPKKSVPFEFPEMALNPWSIGAFNEIFYMRHPTAYDTIVDYDTYFYPLDSIHSWNRIYGRRGFTQYQATVPDGEEQGIVTLLERLSESGRASFLAVLKRMGPAGPGLLSHPISGYTLTLDIPMRDGLVPFLHELDEILLKHRGRLYLAKDVCTRPETFAAMYPRLDEFRAIKARLDPQNRISSRMARRLKIVPA